MFDLFKKKDKITKEMVLTAMKALGDQTRKEVIRIKLKDDKCTIFDSKFGGLPYIPKDGKVPLSFDNKQLSLLAQINLTELLQNEYHLNEGIIQFWALANDVYGLDFDDMTSQKDSRVIYYPNIDMTVSKKDVIEKYHPDIEEDFPIIDTFKLSLIKDYEGISTGDIGFDSAFCNIWNHMYPDNLLKSYFDLPDDAEYEDQFNEFSGFGHKLFGYPAFTQEDPRSEGLYDDYILLLQIDSVGLGDKEIMWGDCGICNFFITKKDLENRDFSKVLYNWDCY